MKFYEKILLLFLPFSVFGSLIGFAMGNSLAYIVSDTYKFAFFSIIYLATILAIRPENAMKFSKALLQFAIIGFSIQFVGLIFTLITVGPGRGGSTAAVFFILPYFLSVETSGGRDPVFRTTKGLRIFIFTGLFLSIFLSFTRDLWVTAFLEILLSLTMVWKPIKTHISLASSFAVIFLGVTAITLTLSLSSPSTYHAINEMRKARVRDLRWYPKTRQLAKRESSS